MPRHVRSTVPDMDLNILTDYTTAMSNVACAADETKPLEKIHIGQICLKYFSPIFSAECTIVMVWWGLSSAKPLKR